MALFLGLSPGCSDSTSSGGGELSGETGDEEGGEFGLETGGETGGETGVEGEQSGGEARGVGGSEDCFLDEHCTGLNECTVGTCVDGACEFEVNAGGECDDGDPCTASSLCDVEGT